jgi:hypothetical protein
MAICGQLHNQRGRALGLQVRLCTCVSRWRGGGGSFPKQQQHTTGEVPILYAEACGVTTVCHISSCNLHPAGCVLSAAAAAVRGRTCSFSQDHWGMCDSSQAENALKIGRTLGGGAAMSMTPCDILPYLRGRTLWILG